MSLTPRCSDCVKNNCVKGCKCPCHGYKWKNKKYEEFET